ncbi:hypothetical protein LCM19_11460 [Qipengyuania flava]|nr:hypothetical protein [Qipengyuania flava]
MIHFLFTMSDYHSLMIEGQFTKKSEEATKNKDVLHKFRWTELVAKLSATRDFREEVARREYAGFQSFGEARRETEGESKRPVYHDGLAHGKSEPLDEDSAADGAVHGDREK